MHDTKRPRSHRAPPPDRERLFDVASEQAGYFTAAQAQATGYSRSLLSHHVKSRLFNRVRHGLYRFRSYPPHPNEDIVAAWLSLGRDRAVLSHQTALSLHGLSDVISDALHFTIPRAARYMRPDRGIVIHTTTKPLPSSEVVLRGGIHVTSPVRSILDSVEAGIGPEQVDRAIRQAIRRGLATTSQLRSAAHQRGARIAGLIGGSLARSRA